MKKCSKCLQEKEEKEFHKCKSRKDGLQCYCILCKNKNYKNNRKHYLEKSKENLNKRKDTEEYKEMKRKYYRDNKERLADKNKIWYNANKERILQYGKEYVSKNREKTNEYKRKYTRNHKEYYKEYHKKYGKLKRESDIGFRIKCNISRRIRTACTQGSSKKCSRTVELLGCDIKTLREHLERLFLVGMSWDNYGYRGWHIDHIKPCALFDLTDEKQQKECFHYTNLQPLWMVDNMKKGCRYIKGE